MQRGCTHCHVFVFRQICSISCGFLYACAFPFVQIIHPCHHYHSQTRRGIPIITNCRSRLPDKTIAPSFYISQIKHYAKSRTVTAQFLLLSVRYTSVSNLEYLSAVITSWLKQRYFSKQTSSRNLIKIDVTVQMKLNLLLN